MGLVDGQVAQVLHPSKKKHEKKNPTWTKCSGAHMVQRSAQVSMKAQKPIHMKNSKEPTTLCAKMYIIIKEIVEDLGYLSI